MWYYYIFSNYLHAYVPNTTTAYTHRYTHKQTTHRSHTHTHTHTTHTHTLGLGGIAILVLKISYRKNCDLTSFTKNLWVDCSIRVFLSFVFRSIAITNLLASKEFLDMPDNTENDNIVSLKFRQYTYHLISITPRYHAALAYKHIHIYIHTCKHTHTHMYIHTHTYTTQYTP